MDRIKQIARDKAGSWTYAMGLYGLMALATLPFVFQLGYNYDDWEGVYLFTQGMARADVWNYFVIDRPFSSLVHWLFYPIFGTFVPAWHWMVMTLHWGAIMLLVLSALRLFPKRVTAIAWMGLLLGVYPGITREFVAFTTMPHYVSMFLFAFSLWAMIKAADSSRPKSFGTRALWAASWLAAFTQVFIIEYFALMEAARLFVILGMNMKLSAGGWFKRIGKSLWQWAPYAIALGAFLGFKFLILPSWAVAAGTTSKHEIALFEEFGRTPIASIAGAVNLVTQDLLHQLVNVWTLPISAKDLDVSSRSYLLSWLIGGIGAILMGVLIVVWQQRDAGELSTPKAKELWWLVGALGLTMALGGAPAWIIGRQGSVGLWSSRFFLAQILGSVPLLVVAVMTLVGWDRSKAASVFFALLVMGGVAYQFREGNHYRLYWETQTDYYWQLKWRAPSLEQGTFIASPNTPFARTSDYQIAYAINLLYDPGNPVTRANYWWFDAPDDLIHDATGTYKDRPISGSMRNIKFEAPMNNALPVLYQPGRGCTQVITDDYYFGEPLLSQEEQGLFVLANDDAIRSEYVAPPASVFGQDPAKNWCWYYQRAERYRGDGDWQAIYALWTDTISLDDSLRPKYGPEYLPFIESFAVAGDWARADTWTVKAAKLTKEAKPFLCEAWQTRLLNIPTADKGKDNAWKNVNKELGCEG